MYSNLKQYILTNINNKQKCSFSTDKNDFIDTNVNAMASART